jgi:alpha-glucan,water dikinase
LDDKINTDIKRKYLNLANNSNRFDTNHCRQLRDTILGLNVPSELMDSLKSMLKTTGLTSKTGSDNHWLSIKKVFASIWNDRAYQGRIAFGIKHSDISMAVLIQEVIDAQYAFVIHTNNPITGNKEEVYAEIVVGLGETLVGNYPGTSLGFKFNKSDKSIKIVSYPNKEIGLYGQGLIFRSDSNAEDLTGYSGAGLYDSITESLPVSSVINYSDERLLWDIDFRTDLMTKIAEIGIIIEEIFGKAQDIEGVYSGEQFYVVQSRPQIS